ncbi:ABC transporter permease [Bifidobacterium sp. SMB2]|uniref:ABC transporter permease n=1 Tax=Bifidobacterium saimiriisciurei TaxID=2661627 RepID=A0ABX0CED5_9BIFI|nr:MULTISPECIES: ABC transporter permease [Bifidobacterium]NEG96147.1 ABC transporter permease [Bifidobacterium sp. SMB2]NEH10775.1 ABC transporter permease [Bifidobacterium saimiriisciurei]
MGRHQQAETLGLIASLVCAVASGVVADLYLGFASAIWLVSGRLFAVCSGMVAACGVASFIVGYSRRSHSWSLKRGWLVPVRRAFETLSLSVVYGSTIFLSMYALFGVINSTMGLRSFSSYVPAVVALFSAVTGYLVFVQADSLNSKTIASLLPLFVVSGVSTAGLTSDDPNWWKNNFSQLGDRTTFAARMFNSTLVLAGVCVIILSYFAVSELIATQRMRMLWRTASDGKSSDAGKSSGTDSRHGDVEIPRFWARIICLSVLLTLAGMCFAGVGLFRYTPHPILHNVFARGLSLPMSLLMVFLPWLAPQLSKAMYVVSDLIIVAIAVAGVHWLQGGTTLTNVEALACILFMGWFIVFSRQIAAIEADRVHAQLMASRPVSVVPRDSRISPRN